MTIEGVTVNRAPRFEQYPAQMIPAPNAAAVDGKSRLRKAACGMGQRWPGSASIASASARKRHSSSSCGLCRVHPLHGPVEPHPRLVAVPQPPVSHGQEEPVEAVTARLHAHRLLQLGDGCPVVAAAVVGHTEGIPVIGGLRPGGDGLLRQPHGPGGVPQAGLRTGRQEPRQIIVNGGVVLFQFESLAIRLGRFGLPAELAKQTSQLQVAHEPGCAGVPGPPQSWP